MVKLCQQSAWFLAGAGPGRGVVEAPAQGGDSVPRGGDAERDCDNVSQLLVDTAAGWRQQLGQRRRGWGGERARPSSVGTTSTQQQPRHHHREARGSDPRQPKRQQVSTLRRAPSHSSSLRYKLMVHWNVSRE